MEPIIASRKETEHRIREAIQQVLSEPEESSSGRPVLVVEHESVYRIRDWDSGLHPDHFRKVLICCGGEFFDIRESRRLLEVREQAAGERDWGKAKAANDVLSDIDFLLQHEENLAFPDYLQIETCSYCNAQCIMCSHYFNGNRDAACLQNETLENMKDVFPFSRLVVLNGMGEPFLSPYVCDQIDLYSHYGNRIATNTNLSFLNERLLEQIRADFDWIEVSCDGASEATYEHIRRGLSFQQFMDNLQRLGTVCPDTRRHIATVIMRQNVREMPQLVHLAKDAGAKIITFMTLNPNIVIQNHMDDMNRYPEVLRYYSRRALEEGEKLGIPVIVPGGDRALEAPAESDEKDSRQKALRRETEEMEVLPLWKDAADEKRMMRTAETVRQYLQFHDERQRDTCPSAVRCSGICDWILKRSYVDLHGSVGMCCRNQSFDMGNVNDMHGFGEIWNGSFYRKLRRIFYSGYLPESCLGCGLIESGNLRYLKVDITDDFYKDAAYKARQKRILRGLLEQQDRNREVS